MPRDAVSIRVVRDGVRYRNTVLEGSCVAVGSAVDGEGSGNGRDVEWVPASISLEAMEIEIDDYWGAYRYVQRYTKAQEVWERIAMEEWISLRSREKTVSQSKRRERTVFYPQHAKATAVEGQSRRQDPKIS